VDMGPITGTVRSVGEGVIDSTTGQ